MNPIPGVPQPGAAAAPPPRPITAEVDSMSFWDRIFPDSMKGFKEDHPKEPRGREEHGYSMRKQNWREVNAQLSRARSSYEGHTGRLGSLKSGARRVLERLQPPAKMVTKVVPENGHRLPRVRCRRDTFRSAEVRDAVFAKLYTLQQAFEAIEVFTTIYLGDQNITDASVTLVAMILKAVEDTAVAKAGIAVLSGDQYQKRLKQSLDSIDTDSQPLLGQARFTNEYLVTIILRNTTRSLEIQESNANLANGMMGLFQENRRLYQANNHLYYQNGFLQGQVQALSRPASPTSSAPPREPSISQEELFMLLDVPDIYQEDLNDILWNRDRIYTREQERAEQLINQHQFRQWVVAQTSARLLVHGDFGAGGELQDVSALSVFTATFVEVMRQAAAACAPSPSPSGHHCSLVFFCGLHTRIFHDFVGPEWMIRSLVAQLLCQGIAFDTTGLEDDVDLNGIVAGDVMVLCDLLVWLCRRIPPDVTLFCLVDGIIFFERPDYAYTMGYVLRDLLDLVEDEGVQSRIKVLITSPIDTRIVRQYHAFINGENTISTDGLQGANGSSKWRLEREVDDKLRSASVG
ncbi:hypothetical protein CHU98_g9834 [Xylaria longipes]|nr:hypothetical protein CHU98_g9834 [Xylaria longipes]